jgi:hypothetical protein
MNPIRRQMKKRNPSSGQNGQLVHWWLLIHSGPFQAPINLQMSGDHSSLTTGFISLNCVMPVIKYGPFIPLTNFPQLLTSLPYHSVCRLTFVFQHCASLLGLRAFEMVWSHQCCVCIWFRPYTLCKWYYGIYEHKLCECIT